MATRLRDARIVVQLDTKSAERKAEKLRKDTARKDEDASGRSAKRKERQRDHRDKQRRGGVAVVPGTSKLVRVAAGLAAIRAVEGIWGIIGGGIREAGKGKSVRYGPLPGMTVDVEHYANKIADMFTEASKLITFLRTQAAAYLSVGGQVIDMATAQKMLEGDLDLDALGKFATRAAQVASTGAELEMGKMGLRRDVQGAAVADVLEKGKQYVIDRLRDEKEAMATGGQG